MLQRLLRPCRTGAATAASTAVNAATAACRIDQRGGSLVDPTLSPSSSIDEQARPRQGYPAAGLLDASSTTVVRNAARSWRCNGCLSGRGSGCERASWEPDNYSRIFRYTYNAPFALGGSATRWSSWTSNGGGGKQNPTTPMSRSRFRLLSKEQLSYCESRNCDYIVSCISQRCDSVCARLSGDRSGGWSTPTGLPSTRRSALGRKPLLPIELRNLRQPGLRKKKRRRGRGDKCSAKGIRLKRDQQARFKGPRSRTFEGGKTPLYRRLPKWPSAWIGRRRKSWDHLNLAKVRQFLEQGRLDARFPVTQRHLHDSRCIKVRNGVHIFNVNDFPFPYKIIIDIASADQSSIDAIRRVGGEVRIVYRHPVNLRAHVKPYKFDVLPMTARPGLEAVHYLEKMRTRGCMVSYVKPQWLEAEERRLQAELQELRAEAAAAIGLGVDFSVRLNVDSEAVAAYRAKGLSIAALEGAEAKSKAKEVQGLNEPQMAGCRPV